MLEEKCFLALNAPALIPQVWHVGRDGRSKIVKTATVQPVSEMEVTLMASAEPIVKTKAEVLQRHAWHVQ